MHTLTDLRDQFLDLLRTIFIGPDAEASDRWDGDATVDDETLGQLMLVIPFI